MPDSQPPPKSYVVTTTSMLQCPHGGVVHLKDFFESMVVDTGWAVPADGVDGVAGCPANPSCERIVWSPANGGVTIDDRPVLTTSTPGMCETGQQAPVGPPVFMTNQLRVEA